MFFYKKAVICLVLFCLFLPEKNVLADDRIVGIQVSVQLVFQVQIEDDDPINIIIEPQRYGLGTTRASGTLIAKDAIATNQHVLDIESLIMNIFLWDHYQRFYSDSNWRLERVNVIIEAEGRPGKMGRRRGEMSAIIQSISGSDDQQIEIYFAGQGIEMIWESANHDLAFVFLSPGNEFADYYELDEPEDYFPGFPVIASAIDHQSQGRPFTGSGDYLGVLNADADGYLGDDLSYFLFELPIRAGCSGGAVLSKDSRRVVAILAGYGLNEYEGMSFGVPVSMVRQEYNKALKERDKKRVSANR